jgi:hypothetical protein
VDRLPLTLEGRDATFRIERPARAVLLMVVSGHDTGEHEDRVFALLDEELRSGPASLFVDARHTRAASTDVSHRWAKWLKAHRVQLLGIHVLPGSWFIKMTAEFVRGSAGLESLMQIHASPLEFETALGGAARL